MSLVDDILRKAQEAAKEIAAGPLDAERDSMGRAPPVAAPSRDDREERPTTIVQCTQVWVDRMSAGLPPRRSCEFVIRCSKYERDHWSRIHQERKEIFVELSHGIWSRSLRGVIREIAYTGSVNEDLDTVVIHVIETVLPVFR